MDCKREENKIGCTCTATTCSNRAICCDCVRHHRDNGELAIVIKEASQGNFQRFINDPSNPHGKANLETKQAFESKGLDYDKWQTGVEE